MLEIPQNNLTFDKKNHRYFLGGMPIPSVTTIQGAEKPIEQWLLNEDRFILATQFGKHVHACTEGDDLGLKREPEIMGDTWAAADLWSEFLGICDAKVLAIELPVFSAEWWYAGTADRIIQLGDERIVVDLKTSALGIKGKIQIAAYIMALREMGIEVDGGLLVSVHKLQLKQSPVKQDHFDRWEKLMLSYNRGEFNA